MSSRRPDNVPDWVVARWACEAALDWMFAREDPRIETAAWTVVATHQPPPPGTRPPEIARRLRQVAAYDEIGHQLALFELGGLADFLDVRAGSRLSERAPRLREWVSRRWSVFEQTEHSDDLLRVRDSVTGQAYDVLHQGAADCVGRGVALFARVAPTASVPGWVFTHEPVAVDPQTADDLVRQLREGPEVDEVFACLGDAVTDGRMPPAPGMRLPTCDRTPLGRTYLPQTVEFRG